MPLIEAGLRFREKVNWLVVLVAAELCCWISNLGDEKDERVKPQFARNGSALPDQATRLVSKLQAKEAVLSRKVGGNLTCSTKTSSLGSNFKILHSAIVYNHIDKLVFNFQA